MHFGGTRVRITTADPRTELLFLMQAANHWHRKLQHTVGELNRIMRHSEALLERCRQLRTIRSGSAAPQEAVSASPFPRPEGVTFHRLNWDAKVFVDSPKLSQNQLIELLKIVDRKGYSRSVRSAYPFRPSIVVASTQSDLSGAAALGDQPSGDNPGLLRSSAQNGGLDGHGVGIGDPGAALRLPRCVGGDRRGPPRPGPPRSRPLLRPRRLRRSHFCFRRQRRLVIIEKNANGDNTNRQ
jgi:hypothetical protein